MLHSNDQIHPIEIQHGRIGRYTKVFDADFRLSRSIPKFYKNTRNSLLNRNKLVISFLLLCLVFLFSINDINENILNEENEGG